MQLLGHRTRSIFDRYAISGRRILKNQTRKLGQLYQSAPDADRRVINLEPR
jgi:hypothetical protein